jgi:hypothetical protein
MHGIDAPAPCCQAKKGIAGSPGDFVSHYDQGLIHLLTIGGDAHCADDHLISGLAAGGRGPTSNLESSITIPHWGW